MSNVYCLYIILIGFFCFNLFRAIFYINMIVRTCIRKSFLINKFILLVLYFSLPFLCIVQMND